MTSQIGSPITICTDVTIFLPKAACPKSQNCLACQESCTPKKKKKIREAEDWICYWNPSRNIVSMLENPFSFGFCILLGNPNHATHTHGLEMCKFGFHEWKRISSCFVWIKYAFVFGIQDWTSNQVICRKKITRLLNFWTDWEERCQRIGSGQSLTRSSERKLILLPSIDMHTLNERNKK